MVKGNRKLTTDCNPVTNLRHIGFWIAARPRVLTKTALLVKPPRTMVFFEHPQRHLGKSPAPQLRKHMIDQYPSIAAAAQVRQHVQRRDVADARGVIVGIPGRDHLTERHGFTLLLDQEYGPIRIGDPVRPELRSIG